ncbi:MAG: hypothetical protein KA788_13795 [Lacunisphaera sp.]|nr:hypothetical protein [Lacunisphaera sp.]
MGFSGVDKSPPSRDCGFQSTGAPGKNLRGLVPQDLRAAYVQYSLAAAVGADAAAKERDRLAKKLPATDLQAAQAQTTRTVAKAGGK